MKIYTKILIGLVAGAVLGIALSIAGVGEWGLYLKPFGDAFVKLIKMIVIPLVMASIILGTASLGDIRKLGRIGAKTISFYLIATAIAVIFGLVAANLFAPGASVDEAKRDMIMDQVQSDSSFISTMENAEAGSTKGASVGDVLLNLIPANPFEAMAKGNMLPIITFSIMFGVALTMIGVEPRNKMMGVLEAINDSMIVLVKMIMTLAPFGVFAIIAAVTATMGIEFLVSLVQYSVVTLSTMAVYFVVFYGVVIQTMSDVSAITFFKAIRPVALLAFSTASSNATLPENMEVCREKLGVSKEITSFALPLGATINMNGTAIYQGISVIFIAQVFGMDLSITQQLMVVLTASLASIGAAGVPGIGMVTLAMVLSSVGIDTAGIALVLGVERILDMARTVLNVTGDAAAAVIVGSSEGGLSVGDPEDTPESRWGEDRQ